MMTMQLVINDTELQKAVDLIMKERGYVPEEQIVGRIIFSILPFHSINK